MRITLILALICLSPTGRILAQDKPSGLFVWPVETKTNAVSDFVTLPKPTPTRHTLPEDIEQGSIQMFRFSTNSFAVRFSYTEAGAKKALACWEANPKHPAISAEWKTGWLKRRTDKCFFQSEGAATEFMKSIKTK